MRRPARRSQEAPAPRLPLDPEIEARRLAAFRLIRPFGDPVLRSKAGDVTRFDDSLREEVARMDRLMGDALGLGLAADAGRRAAPAVRVPRRARTRRWSRS